MSASNVVPLKNEPQEAPKTPERRRAKHLPSKLTTLISTAADAFHMTPALVLGNSRCRSETRARHVVMWIMRRRWSPTLSFPEIGKLLGYHHTTVMSGVARIDKEIEKRSETGLIALRLTALGPQFVPGEGMVIDLGEP